MFFWLLFILLTLPMCLFLPMKVFGKKHYNKKKKYIVVCNHQSILDPVILDFHLGKRIRFIAKKELWKNKEKSFLFDTVLGCIPVDRSKGLTISATKEVYLLLKNNESLGLFPEGTRNSEPNHDMQIKSGACLFAIKSKTPILPCYITSKPKLFSKNNLLIGKPFELSEFYDKKLDKDTLVEAQELLLQKMNELKDNYNQYIMEKNMIKKLKKSSKNNLAK